MVVSLLYRAARTMLSIPAVLLRRDSTKDAGLLVLRHKNAVLRRQLKGPVRYECADRFWLSVLSSLDTAPGGFWPGRGSGRGVCR
jgi:putative transposase